MYQGSYYHALILNKVSGFHKSEDNQSSIANLVSYSTDITLISAHVDVTKSVERSYSSGYTDRPLKLASYASTTCFVGWDYSAAVLDSTSLPGKSNTLLSFLFGTSRSALCHHIFTVICHSLSTLFNSSTHSPSVRFAHNLLLSCNSTEFE